VSQVPDPQPQQAPALRVVSGQPTAEELAAVVVVFGAVAARGSSRPAGAPRRSQWAAPARLVRAPIVAGPGAWRASALPR
jgi:hypothetical protein